MAQRKCCCGDIPPCNCIVACIDDLGYCDLVVEVPAGTFTNITPTTNELDDICWYCEDLNGLSIPVTQRTMWSTATNCRWFGTPCIYPTGATHSNYMSGSYVIGGTTNDHCEFWLVQVQLLEVTGDKILRVEFAKIVFGTFTAMFTFEANLGAAKVDCPATFDAGVTCDWVSTHANVKCETDEVTPSSVVVKANPGEQRGIAMTNINTFAYGDTSPFFAFLENDFEDGPWWSRWYDNANDYWVGSEVVALFLKLDGLTNDPCLDCEDIINGREYRLYCIDGSYSYGPRFQWQQSLDGGEATCSGNMKLDRIILDVTIGAAGPSGHPYYQLKVIAYFYSGGTVFMEAEQVIAGDQVNLSLATNGAFSWADFHAYDWSTGWTFTEKNAGLNDCDWTAASMALRIQRNASMCFQHDHDETCIWGHGRSDDPAACPRYFKITGMDHWVAEGGCSANENCDDFNNGTYYLTTTGPSTPHQYVAPGAGACGFTDCCARRMYMTVQDTGTKLLVKVVCEYYDHIVQFGKEYDYEYAGGANVMNLFDIDDDFVICSVTSGVNERCIWDGMSPSLSESTCPTEVSGGPYEVIHVQATNVGP